MVKISLKADPLLGGVDRTLGDNRILERDDLAIVSIAIPLRGKTALLKALKAGWGLAPAKATVSSVKKDHRLVQTTPDQFLVLFPHKAPDAEALVQAKLQGAGYTTDQTDAFIALEISGPDTLPALERICPLDLSTSAFPVGSSGRTVMEHMSAIIIRLDAMTFLLLSASSSAASFLETIETSYRNVLD